MALPQSPTSSSTSTPTATPSPVPPPVPVETHPNRAKQPGRTLSDPNRLAPDDVFKALSPPRLRPLATLDGSAAASAAAAALRPAVASLRKPPAIPPVAARLEQERRRAASRRRRQPHVWKKLLWIKQHGFPDNYTDPATFLDHLQRNPKLRPYEFWPLVADSMVIVQHVCAVAVFISAYAGIYQDRLSPVAVVACGTIATLTGWVMWDHWMRDEEARNKTTTSSQSLVLPDDHSSNSSNSSASPAVGEGFPNGSIKRGLGLSLSTSNLAAKNLDSGTASKHATSMSRSSFQSISPIDPLNDTIEPFPSLHPTTSNISSASKTKSVVSYYPFTLPSSLSHHNQARLKTFKSALLIYFALLGLSPILKSLTKSTSSDSIWALATWLLIINIFFFDYGSQYIPENGLSRNIDITSPPATTKDATPSLSIPTITISTSATTNAIAAPPFPSSLSTNAAVMASTVLASRLPTTTAVFSLSLFSIQVFGLFPVFRRHLRHESFFLHVLLTIALILMSSGGLGLILSQSYTHTYGDCGFCFGWIWHVVSRSMLGCLVGGLSAVFVMGGCSWWLIGLQRYKNVVIGPWDPARPVLAGRVHGRSRGGTD